MSSLDDYLATVRQRLAAETFAPMPAPHEYPAGVDIFHRWQSGRMAPTSTFALLPTAVTTAEVERLTARSHELFEATRQLQPSGAATEKRPLVVVFALIATRQVGHDVARWVTRYTPRHWMAEEFVALFDLEAGTLLTRAKTPVWGAAYAKRFRRIADDLFGVR